MVQVPASISEADVPEAVQTGGVVDEKLTGSPELAVAAKVTFDRATWLPIAGKLMVCDACPTVCVNTADVLPALLLSPLYTAVMLCAPAAKLAVE